MVREKRQKRKHELREVQPATQALSAAQPAYHGEPMVTFNVKRRVLLRSRVRELRKHGSERGVTTTKEEVFMNGDHIVAACSEVYP